jgi:hypothetical protein
MRRYWRMTEQWTPWRRFPNSWSREHLSAPIGPGLYELRCIRTGQALAFGQSANLALTLSNRRAVTLWRRLADRWYKLTTDDRDIEYRILATATAQQADDHAHTLTLRRQAWWSRVSSR